MAGLGDAHAALADQRGALCQVTWRDEAGDRDGGEVCIGHVQRAVGKGQAPGFGEQVHGLGCRFKLGRRSTLDRSHLGDGQARVAGFQRLQCPKDLRHGYPARGRRWHAADLPLFVVGAQRCALLGGVALEVGLGQAAGIAMALYLACDFIGNRALV